MSHYCVGVIIDNIGDIDNQVAKILAPYDESLVVEPYICQTKKQIIDKAWSKRANIILRIRSDGNYIPNEWEQQLLNVNSDDDIYKISIDEDATYDKDGNEISTYNPNSKWDWWSVGGRFHNDPVIQIKDFVPYQEPSDEMRMLYEKAWDSFHGKYELTEDEERRLFTLRYFNDNYYLTRYKSCEDWIRHDYCNIPYAFVDKDGWYEQGSMGWFGCDDADAESIAKYLMFAEKYFQDSQNQNKYMVWVDCHI